MKSPFLGRLTQNAKVVLGDRYLLRDSEGNTVESPEGLFLRVSKAIADVESKNRRKWNDKFAELMCSLRFLPNSPTLMNAGRERGQLSACFVLPVEDSLDSIFDALKSAALIHQSGGGTGFSFSRIRPKNSRVHTTDGVASGPVSYIHIFDTATETIKQGGKRRGANMAVLRVDHPDIIEFIESKTKSELFTNFNISVGVNRAFIDAVERRLDINLTNHQGKVVRSLPAFELWQKIVDSAWLCGDPGLVFLDRMNFFNPTPLCGEFESTNPCGEQPLLPYESCNLGSLNLGLYYRDGELDWNLLREDIGTAVRFLDNVIDANSYPVDECRKITKRNRKIGLGVMGFADLLLKSGLNYSSQAAFLLGEKVMSFIDREAKRNSALLALERGPFPNWKGSMWERLGYPCLRNSTVSTVAPTGTISMIAGASSGIEPIFSGIFYRNVLSGKKLTEVHPAVEELLLKNGVPFDQMNDARIIQELGQAWSPAYLVSVESHVRMQAVFQRFSDSAVSKTINLPESATKTDISNAYLNAYRLGCKGITVYRDKSRSVQVLEQAGRGNAAASSPDPFFCPSC